MPFARQTRRPGEADVIMAFPRSNKRQQTPASVGYPNPESAVEYEYHSATHETHDYFLYGPEYQSTANMARKASNSSRGVHQSNLKRESSMGDDSQDGHLIWGLPESGSGRESQRKRRQKLPAPERILVSCGFPLPFNLD